MLWYSAEGLTPTQVNNLVGLIPVFLEEYDLRPARDQINDRYGGWRPMADWTLLADGSILFEGDPPLSPVAWTHLRDETIIVYRYGWVAVIAENGTFEVSRCD
jgi:hypothetical protein